MLPTVLRKRRAGDVSNWFGDLDHLVNAAFSERDNSTPQFPRVDIHEDEDHYYIEADLPGLDKDDIKLNIEDELLTLSGKREENHEEKKKGYYRLERQTGHFERQFRLNEHVDVESTKAEFDKGVLKVSLPKKEEAKPKQLDIKIS